MKIHTPRADGLCQFHSTEQGTSAERGAKGGRKSAVKRQPLVPPADPQSIDDARAYLSWIARNALTGALHPPAAQAAVKAIHTWLTAEGYSQQFKTIRKQLDELKAKR